VFACETDLLHRLEISFTAMLSSKKLLGVLIYLASKLGSKLRTVDGTTICRAFLLPWAGRIHVIGLPNDVQLRPIPLPTANLSYWRQSIAWEQAGAIDDARLLPPRSISAEKRIATIVICHLDAAQTLAVYRQWKANDPEAIVLIAYGGDSAEFEKLDPSIEAVFIGDEKLRTTAHVRERQEYQGIIQNAYHWLQERRTPVSHIHMVEFDVFPAVEEAGKRLAEILEADHADLLGYGLRDLSGAIHPHNTYELSNASFMEFLRKISIREETDRIVTMLGCSSLWRFECFEAIASTAIPEVYLEVGIPSTAHHLGYRVRPVPPSQEASVTFQGDRSNEIDHFRKHGAILVHPCKSIWHSSI
jgi:hypothetical protein